MESLILSHTKRISEIDAAKLLADVKHRKNTLKDYVRKLSDDFESYLSICNLDELRELNILVFSAYNNAKNLKKSIKNFTGHGRIQENKEILMNKNMECCLMFMSVQKAMASLELLQLKALDAA